MSKRLITLGAITLFSLVGVAVGISQCTNSYREKPQRLELLEKVAVVADADEDGVTLTEEWELVYQELGIQFDYLHPRDLTKDEMNRYLGRHECKVLELTSKYGANFEKHFFQDSK
jgi:hypothetical protein